jgi:CBS domain-containing protein
MIADLMVRNPVCVPPETPINIAVSKMAAAGIGCVLVCEGESLDTLVGIFSERDLVQMFTPDANTCFTCPVSEYMTPSPYTIGPTQAPVEALCLMTEHHVRHLPVVADGKLKGILGLRDLVKLDEISP